jgi:hypothetical protein
MDLNCLCNDLANAVVNTDRLETLLENLGCEFRGTFRHNTYRGPCPVHGGDGMSCELKTEGFDLPVRWRCFSNHCHEKYKPSLVGLVRGILSFQENREVPFGAAVAYLRKFLAGTPIPVSKPRWKPVQNAEGELSLTREQVRRRLQIPCPYMLSRGFSPEILDKMDIGFSEKIGRSVVPFYDDKGHHCIGYTAGSPHSKCPREGCGLFHPSGQACPTGFAVNLHTKWLVNKGFSRSSYLYGYAWIPKAWCWTILLVEGPGDVLKAMEAGLPAVAALGSDLCREQIRKLRATKINIAVAFDNDEPGRNGMVTAVKRLIQGGIPSGPLFVPVEFHDLGEMPPDKIKRWFS